ncbi:cupredoxin domain-containing protein [Ferrimonas futtsuensis]|uniref:cupredoxin domain-containing protein n=1 Tax=Ferrimonas futtsuensis TaxID=364764 RepID=UPI0004103813|nr:cupredoxin domain-containing protein [Ferrimonas futtsuensis]
MLWFNLAALMIIGLIVWWFWLDTPAQAQARNDRPIAIVVANGVYQPARVHASVGQTLTLRFLRQDTSPCAELVQFPELGLSVTLPIGHHTEIQLPALDKGEYAFHCQMQMYRGKLIID